MMIFCILMVCSESGFEIEQPAVERVVLDGRVTLRATAMSEGRICVQLTNSGKKSLEGCEPALGWSVFTSKSIDLQSTTWLETPWISSMFVTMEPRKPLSCVIDRNYLLRAAKQGHKYIVFDDGLANRKSRSLGWGKQSHIGKFAICTFTNEEGLVQVQALKGDQ